MRESLGGAFLDGLRDAEIHDLGDFLAAPGTGDEDVVGLEVAVHDAQLVGGAESVGDLAGEVERAVDGEGGFAGEDAREGLAVHELHHQVDEPIALSVVEHGGDVGMDDTRRVGGLAGEAGGGLGVVHERGAHDLDGALAIHLDVLAEVHSAHAPFADALEDVITVREHPADEGIGALGTECGSVAGAEAGGGLVLVAAVGADLEDGDGFFRDRGLPGEESGAESALGECAGLGLAGGPLLLVGGGYRFGAVGGHTESVRWQPPVS